MFKLSTSTEGVAADDDEADGEINGVRYGFSSGITWTGL